MTQGEGACNRWPGAPAGPGSTAKESVFFRKERRELKKAEEQRRDQGTKGIS